MLSEQAVGRAINERLLVTFTYEGDARTFAPYVMWEAETGNVVVYGFQVRTNDPFGNNGPHTFTVSKIADIAVTAERFSKDPTFDTGKYRERVLYIIKDF